MPANIALPVTLMTILLSGCVTNKAPESVPSDSTLSETSLSESSANEELIKAPTDATAQIEELESNGVEIDSDIPRAELVASLPKTIESFEIETALAFDVDGESVNVRYANDRKHRRADVFMYPVSEENRSLKHPELVMGSTQATIRAISHAVQEGVYHNLDVIDAATKAYGLRTIARVQATYLRENLASYTVVYQTEHDGTMVKIRMTMPDNASNRESQEWDRFVDVVLTAVTTKLDEQNAASPKIEKTAAL